MEEDKNSLTIMAIYSSDGIIDDYLIYFLESLEKVTDRIIAAVNGSLTLESKKKLGAVTEDIYIRQNTGFDFGAYKDVIENYLHPKEIISYKELILCNDTCFGPFVPFENIFFKMNNKNLDFWSINYIDDLLLPHFQSYFMVFRKKGIRVIRDFLYSEVDAYAIDMVQAHGYEHALSEVILKEGLKTDYYTSNIAGNHNIDIFGAPDYAMRLLGFPMMKKKSLSPDFCKWENCYEAIRLITEKGKYPVSYILEIGNRVYHEDFLKKRCNMPIPQLQTFKQNYTSRLEVIKFCRKNKKVYVYGNGYMSVLFMARFRRYMNEFGGYVVSDKYYKETNYCGDRVYPLSGIEENVPLIIALMREASLQVLENVIDRRNVLFLSIEQGAEEKNGEVY